MLLWSAVFIISLFALIKGSDYFTNSAEEIGLWLGVHPFTVGVTIVALGTSLPELASSIAAVAKGASEIVAGNVVGSNIANILLVLGVAAIIARRIKITFSITHIDLPFLVASTFMLYLTMADGLFDLFDAVLFLIGLAAFIGYNLKKQRYGDLAGDEKSSTAASQTKNFVILLISVFFIYLGAKYTIDSILQLARILEIKSEVIAVSIVALGTSLPELAVSITAARKGNADMAVGNVLGSNIFNAFAVMGIPALLGPLTVTPDILNLALPIMVISTFLFYVICHDNEVSLWEGILLLLFYVFFIGKLFVT